MKLAVTSGMFPTIKQCKAKKESPKPVDQWLKYLWSNSLCLCFIFWPITIELLNQKEQTIEMAANQNPVTLVEHPRLAFQNENCRRLLGSFSSTNQATCKNKTVAWLVTRLFPPKKRFFSEVLDLPQLIGRFSPHLAAINKGFESLASYSKSLAFEDPTKITGGTCRTLVFSSKNVLFAL